MTSKESPVSDLPPAFGPDLAEVFGPSQLDGGPELVQLLTPPLPDPLLVLRLRLARRLRPQPRTVMQTMRRSR